MIRQVIFSLTTEGPTDEKFLGNVIFRLLEDLSWKCEIEFDVYPVQIIRSKGDTFIEKMLEASKQAFSISDALCIHNDADDKTVNNVMQHKIKPFLDEIVASSDNNLCRIIVPTIPVQMIESWMLADTQLLKSLIDASKISNRDLGIDKSPESYSDPKSTISNAISIALAEKTKRRRDQVTISDLYETLGSSISLDALRQIPSFRSFEDEVCNALKKLGLMKPN